MGKLINTLLLLFIVTSCNENANTDKVHLFNKSASTASYKK